MDGHPSAGRRWTEPRLQTDSPSHPRTFRYAHPNRGGGYEMTQRRIFSRILAAAVVAAFLLVLSTSCSSSSKNTTKSQDSSVATAYNNGANGNSNESMNSSSTTQQPTATTKALRTDASILLVGSWFGEQADSLWPTCQGTTTWRFAADGTFFAQTMYNPNSLGNCTSFTIQGTWSADEDSLTISAIPSSAGLTIPGQQPNTFTDSLSFPDRNTFIFGGKMSHRS